MVDDAHADSDAYELRHYVRVLRRRWLAVVVPAVALAVAGFLVAKAGAGTYESRARVLVQPTSPQSALTPGGGNAGSARTLSANELAVMSSDSIREAVEDEVGHEVDVTIRALDDESNVAVVVAESDDRDTAEDDAQTYIETYVERRRNQLSSTITEATSQIQAQIGELDTQIGALAGPIQDLDAQIIAAIDPIRLNGLENQREEFLQQRNTLQDRRSALLQQVDQLQLAVNLNPTFGVEILSNASDAESPGGSTPRRYAIAAGLLGLLLGVVLAFAREHFDDTVRTKRDLDTAAPGVTILGIIPRPRLRRSGPLEVLTGSKHAAAVEAYRKLRTSVQLACDGRHARLVLVVSPNPREGRTLTAANLGAALASAGRRVVLVDGNLRRPRLHEVFGLPDTAGLTSVLTANTPTGPALHAAPGNPNLSVLPAGAPVSDPAALLSTANARQVLRSLEGDYVIVDGPPLLPVTDGLVLASIVDAVVVLGRANHTSAPDLAAASEQLEQAGAFVAGSVLNGADRREAHVSSYRDRRAVGGHAAGAGPASPTVETAGPAPPPPPTVGSEVIGIEQIGATTTTQGTDG